MNLIIHVTFPIHAKNFDTVGANYDLVIASHISKTVAWTEKSRENLLSDNFTRIIIGAKNVMRKG